MDLVEVFSELYQVENEVFKAQVGLDEDDYADREVQELLEVYDEVKHGLEDGIEEEGEEESEEMESEYEEEEGQDGTPQSS